MLYQFRNPTKYFIFVLACYTSKLLPAQPVEAILSLTQKEITSESKELEDKLRKAARQGFFYVEIPSEAQELIPDAVHFAHTFHKNENLNFPHTYQTLQNIMY